VSDARVALARLGKDDWSLEVERDRQRRLDRAGRHRQLDYDHDSDLDFDSDLDCARVCEGEKAVQKVAVARDCKAQHGGDRTWNHVGFGRGFGHVGRGDHGRLRGSKELVPLTKLGRLVKTGMLSKIEQTYLHSLPIKEHKVLETLVPGLTGAHRDSLEEHASWRSISGIWRWIALGSCSWTALTGSWIATATPTSAPTLTRSQRCRQEAHGAEAC